MMHIQFLSQLITLTWDITDSFFKDTLQDEYFDNLLFVGTIARRGKFCDQKKRSHTGLQPQQREGE